MPVPAQDFSLLKTGALSQLTESLRIAGHATAGESLISRVQKHAAYLEQCSQEAELVLSGDVTATDRLWLLLNEPVASCPIGSETMLDEIATQTQLVEPR